MQKVPGTGGHIAAGTGCEDARAAGAGRVCIAKARGLTTALVPYRPLGELAGDVLIARLAGRPAPPLLMLPTPLAMRATTAAPSKSHQ